MDICKIHRKKAKTNRRRTSVLVHGSGNGSVISMREFGENSGVQVKGVRDAECSLKGKQGRKALGDVNRLSVAGPVITIDCSSPLMNQPKLFEKIQSPPKKNVNFSSKQKKDSSRNRKSPGQRKIPKTPVAQHLYGLLTQSTRTHEASTPLWHTWEEIEITEDDSDDCVEILYENLSADGSSSTTTEINNNQIKMPKLERQIPEQRIIPAYSQEILQEWKRACSKRPTIKEEKIYFQKDFNTQNFLKRSYNPRLHFLSEHRQCQPNEKALHFLSNCFQNINLTKIAKIYKVAKYNISRAAHLLKRSKSSAGKRRHYHPVEPEDITQYQEMEYIRYFCKLP